MKIQVTMWQCDHCGEREPMDGDSLPEGWVEVDPLLFPMSSIHITHAGTILHFCGLDHQSRWIAENEE